MDIGLETNIVNSSRREKTIVKTKAEKWNDLSKSNDLSFSKCQITMSNLDLNETVSEKSTDVFEIQIPYLLVKMIQSYYIG